MVHYKEDKKSDIKGFLNVFLKLFYTGNKLLAKQKSDL